MQEDSLDTKISTILRQNFASDTYDQNNNGIDHIVIDWEFEEYYRYYRVFNNDTISIKGRKLFWKNENLELNQSN